jgi:hypothetical protein
MGTTILALDADADADRLVEILSTTEGMRSVWTSNCDVAGGKARFGFAMAPVDLECTLEVVDGTSVRYTIESGFPFWNGSVFEWELGPAVRAETGTNLLFRHHGFEDGYPETDLAFTSQTWALIQQTIKSHAEGGTPGPALG